MAVGSLVYVIRIIFKQLAKKFVDGLDELVTWPANSYGAPIVSGSIRHVEACTPTNTDIPRGPCDAIYLSADTNVTFVAADSDTGSPITLALKAGSWIPLSCIRITNVATGTAALGWLRRPAS